MPSLTRPFQDINAALDNIGALIRASEPRFNDLSTSIRRLERVTAPLAQARAVQSPSTAAYDALGELLEVIAEILGLLYATREQRFGTHRRSDKPIVPKNRLRGKSKELRSALRLVQRFL